MRSTWLIVQPLRPPASASTRNYRQAWLLWPRFVPADTAFQVLAAPSASGADDIAQDVSYASHVIRRQNEEKSKSPTLGNRAWGTRKFKVATRLCRAHVKRHENEEKKKSATLQTKHGAPANSTSATRQLCVERMAIRGGFRRWRRGRRCGRAFGRRGRDRLRGRRSSLGAFGAFCRRNPAVPGNSR